MAVYIERVELQEDLIRQLESEDRLIFLVGPHGAGKTALLQRLQSLLAGSILIQVEPIAASPEILCQRFLELAGEAIPSPSSNQPPSYRYLLESVARGKADTILLLDELTELRTLSYFPGVEKPLKGFLAALVRGGARCMATSRFPFWLRYHLQSLPEPLKSRIDICELPPMTAKELEAKGVDDARWLASSTGGLPAHIMPLLQRLDNGETLDKALANEIASGGHLEAECRAALGELLHRARGYGACKAVLYVLAAEQPLTLSEIARRLNRTAGSTRDYLRWLEEVELIRARDKRFALVDPILRLWLRLYGRGQLPTATEISNQVIPYIQRIQLDRAASVAEEKGPSPRKDEELIEID